MKKRQVFFAGIAALVASSMVSAAGWKPGNVQRLQTSGYAELNYGQCGMWFKPVNETVDMSECNGTGDGQYYVTFDCGAESAPTTGLTRNSARIGYENAQIAALTDKKIVLYIEDVQVNGWCVATQTSLVFAQ